MIKKNPADLNTFQSETCFIRDQTYHVSAQCEHSIRLAGDDGVSYKDTETSALIVSFCRICLKHEVEIMK